jgi:polar amino acid transport system substrate-binding protein
MFISNENQFRFVISVISVLCEFIKQSLLPLMLLLSFDTQAVEVYLYHIQPPFITDPNSTTLEGLAVDFTLLLNKQSSNGEPKYLLTPRPRARLNRELAPWIYGNCSDTKVCNSDWMVLFVTPFWGWGDQALQRFEWVSLFEDADLVISAKNHPIEYDGLASFTDKIFGTVLGHKYPEPLEQMFKRGDSTRQDVARVSVAVERILLGRVDVAIIQKSHFDYLLTYSSKADEIKKGIHVATQPFKTFTLQVMLPPNRPDLMRDVEAVSQSEPWCHLLHQYGVMANCRL